MTNMIRQAVVTKWIGPTSTRGSRVKATASAGSITLHWDHTLNPEQNHMAAAKALAEKFSWKGDWYAGGMPNDSGYCFICTDGCSASLFSTFGEH